MKRALRLLGTAALAGALLFSACGGEEQPAVTEITDGSGSASGSATASGETGDIAPSFTAGDADGIVQVTVKEWAIAAEPVVVKGPKVYFEVKNEGSEVHELAVTKAGATDEEGAYGEVVNIGPGAMKPLALELQPGTS